MSENPAMCPGVAMLEVVHYQGSHIAESRPLGLLHSRPKSALIFNRLGLGTKGEPRAFGHGLMGMEGSAGISCGPVNHEG